MGPGAGKGVLKSNNRRVLMGPGAGEGSFVVVCIVLEPRVDVCRLK